MILFLFIEKIITITGHYYFKNGFFSIFLTEKKPFYQILTKWFLNAFF